MVTREDRTEKLRQLAAEDPVQWQWVLDATVKADAARDADDYMVLLEDALDRLVRGHDDNAWTKKTDHLTEAQKLAYEHARKVLEAVSDWYQGKALT